MQSESTTPTNPRVSIAGSGGRIPLTMRARHQSGYVYRKDHTWYVRYYDTVLGPSGPVRVRRAKVLAPVCDRYRSRGQVRSLAEQVLRPVNEGRSGFSLTISQFVDRTYLPHVAATKRPTTAASYRNKWRRLEPLCGAAYLRDFRTLDAQQLMDRVARETGVSHVTLFGIKNLLSGIFVHARRMGVFDGANPVQGVSVPGQPDAAETYAYSLGEVTKMLDLLSGRARVTVAVAAFTGLRRGEIRGLRWSDYGDRLLWVRRSVCDGHVTQPKSQKSRAPVPVIAQLEQILDSWRSATGSDGYVFQAGDGKPLDLGLVAREIRQALPGSCLTWHGWHAFRRGLATNLSELGVDLLTTQAILRHANPGVTAQYYVKVRTERSAREMDRLAVQIGTQWTPESAGAATSGKEINALPAPQISVPTLLKH